MFGTAINTLLGTENKALKRNIPASPKHLFPLETSVQKELQLRKIDDLTAILWDQHCKGEIDLTLPFCFGREREIMQIVVLLSTIEQPGNILITGQTGCGKTILIYELARQILMRRDDHVFSGQHVLLVNEPIGTDTLHYLAQEVGKKAILVFDECHKNLTSEKPNFNSLKEIIKLDFDAFADKCKPLLGENKLSIIGLTDRLGGFLKWDPARERRFSLVTLEELSIEATIEVIQKKKFQEKYSDRLGRPVEIGEETMRCAIYLSMVYFKKICLPSKAFLILDPAVCWYLKMHPEEEVVPPSAVIDYAVEVLGHKREDVIEKFQQADDLARSPIPPHEPLAKFSTNMTSLARRGKLAPAWKREELICSLAVIFGQEEFNSVLLTAPPGAGKSRISEGFAYAVQNGDLPNLAGKEVLLLNWELAKRDLPSLLKSARKYHGKFILIIDEAHRITGSQIDFRGGLQGLENIADLAGDPMSVISGLMQNVGSNGDLFNELKEAMGRGELPTLFLTTHYESTPLLKDPAFMRRVERKKLEYLTKEEVEFVLQNEIHTLSKRYQADFDIDLATAEAIYYLSKVLYKREFQPSASIKVLHSVCNFASYHQITTITLETLFNAIALKEGTDAPAIEALYQKEKDADHPSSRRIPDDEAIKRFSDDWTKEARMHPPSNYVGHEQELLKMQTTLCRATCNNVLLIGNAGTGKTTLVRRLAELMASDDERLVPPALRNKPLFALRLNELREDKKAFAEFVASAKAYAGQYVLFIDEIHLLLGNGGTSLLPGISRELEELKPLLSDGAITLIGATTEEDMRFVSLSHAVKRRFKPIELLSPEPQVAVRMLEAAQPEMELQLTARLGQRVRFTRNALRQAVVLANKEQLPASAISILEIGAVETQNNSDPDEDLLVDQVSLHKTESSYFDRHNQIPNINTSMFHLLNVGQQMMQSPQTRESSGGFWTFLGRCSTFIIWSFRYLTSIITWPFRYLASFF